MIAQSAPVLTGIRHMVTHHERTTALAAGWLSWNAGMAVETTTGNTGLGVWAQLGVAGLIVVAIMFMLRRSDQRDNAKDACLSVQKPLDHDCPASKHRTSSRSWPNRPPADRSLSSATRVTHSPPFDDNPI